MLQNDMNLSVIKRDGSREAYSPEKMYKFLLKITGNEHYAKNLMEKTTFRIKEEIKIQDLIDIIINTCVQEISLIYPEYDHIAAKLFATKIRKQMTGSFEYPHLRDVIETGKKFKIYKKEFINSFSDEEIEELNSYIKPERDFNFEAYKAITIFYDKYCLNKSKTVKMELPQHSYMRVAMFLGWKENNRMEFIKETYDMLSLHTYTMATPIMCNAGTNHAQMSSCVLAQTGDDTNSILTTFNNLAIYSKNKGGTAFDCSRMRANGSSIGGVGVSAGAIPFIKILNEIISSWNQQGVRKGASCVYFTIFNLDILSLIQLKDNGGVESLRARNLQYSVKIDDVFIERWKNNECYTLFCPSDVPLLLDTFGDEFKKHYLNYEASSIRKKKINARELFDQVLKYRVETGNLYIFFTDNVNKQNMLNAMIHQSNLCLAGDTMIDVLHNGKETTIRIDDIKSLIDSDSLLVKSYNFNTGKIEYNKVLAWLDRGDSNDLIEISTESGNNILVTSDHKVYTTRGFVKVIDLNEDDMLVIPNLDVDGEIEPTKIMTLRKVDETTRVYDITVETNHQFFGNNLLIHNCTEIVLSTTPPVLESEKLITEH